MNSKNIIVFIVGFLIIGTGIYFVKNQNSNSTISTESGTYSAPVDDLMPAPTPATVQAPESTLPSEPIPAPTPTHAPAPTLTPEPEPEPAPAPALMQEPTPAPVTHNLTIQDFAFNQSSLTIKKGDTVVWTNKDSAPHTVTSNNGGPSSATLNQNQAYSFTFQSAGSFSYICNFHPSMAGTVTVTN